MDGQVIQILTHNDYNGIDTSLDQYETTLYREKGIPILFITVNFNCSLSSFI